MTKKLTVNWVRERALDPDSTRRGGNLFSEISVSLADEPSCSIKATRSRLAASALW